MAENDVTIQINLDAKDAQAAIELFGKESAKVLKKTEAQASDFFASFKSGVGPVTAVIGTIIGAYKSLGAAIESAVEDAKLTRQIEASLRATDEASQEAVASVIEFADAIKNSTGVSDDLAKQTFITAKSFGVSAEEAKNLTTAALDYAAATGVDVETAVRQLGGTLDGTIGKVGNLGAEFRNLTEEQLKNGAAVDLVAQKFGGTASRELETFQGATNSLNNAIDDFLKAIGKLVTESPGVVSAIRSIADSINFLSESVFNNPIGKLNDQIKTEKIKQYVDTIENAGKQSKIAAISFADIVKESERINQSSTNVTTFSDRIRQLGESASQSGKLTGKALEEAQKKAKALAEEGNKFKQSVLSTFGDDISREAGKAQEALQKTIELEIKGALSFKDAYDLKLKIAEDFNNKVISLEEQRAKEQRKILEDAAKEAKDLRDKQDAEFSKNAGIATGIGANILQGRQGAVSAVGTAAELAGQAFGIPGLGQVATLLSAGPEQTKAMVRAFVEALPDIIQAISESIPVVVEVLVDTLVNKGGAARIGIAIAKAMVLQPVWGKLGEEIFGKSGEEIGNVIGQTVAQESKAAQSAFDQFVTQAPTAIAKGTESLTKQIQLSLQEAPRRFSEGARQFVEGFGTAFTNFFASFAQNIGLFFQNLGQTLLGFVPNLVSALSSSFSNLFSPLQNSFGVLTNALNSLIQPINDLRSSLSGGKGGGRGLIAEGLGRVGKALGLAEGGIVPLYAADGAMVPRGTDTVPAMLTPGEMVIPRDMVSELGDYLASKNGNQAQSSDTEMLAAILAAVNSPIVVKTEAKVNQNAFADIILQLNRQNARLSA